MSEQRPSVPDWPYRDADPGARPRPSLRVRLRDSARLVAGSIAAGIVLGAVARFLFSLPADVRGLVIASLIVGAVGFLGVAVWFVASNGFDGGRIGVALLALIAGTVGGSALGPTVAPPVTIEGTYSLELVTPKALHLAGRLDCTWAAGHGRIDRLAAREPLDLGGPPLSLAVLTIERRIELDAPGSRLVAFGERFAPPGGSAPWGAGDRSGTVVLDLVQVLIPDDPGTPSQVTGTFSWDCPGPEGAAPAGVSDPALGAGRSGPGG